MYTNSIFVFGAGTLGDIKQDAITSLPLEMSWKIFSYLDDVSLRAAVRVTKTWKRIISSDIKLRKRLNMFELGLKLGSHHLARFYKDNKRKVKSTKSKKYVPVYQYMDDQVEKTFYNLKRGGDELVICVKRLKLN